MRRKTKTLTAILDEMIENNRGYNTLTIHLLITAFAYLSDLKAQGAKIEIDDVDQHAYFELIAKRKEESEHQRLKYERAAKRHGAKADQYPNFHPHNDYWSWMRQDALNTPYWTLA